MGDNTVVAKTFRSLVESADRKFVRVREIPLYGHRVPHHYYRKVFKAYTKLWKFQQLNRSKLVESGLQRWEIGEIASRIGQLYYAQYMRTSETRFLLEAYVFYEAILNRGYFEGTKGGIGGTGSSSFMKNPNLLFKELRFYARFLVVSLVLNRTEMVKILAERFRNIVDDSKATFRDTNFKEWKLVVQEIVRFLKVDTDFMHIKPLRYCATFDSHPDSLPYVARFHAKRVLKLHDAVLTSYHRNEVKFTELTLDTFRMLQCLEWEPSGTFFQMRTTESNNHVNSNDQSGPSGLIDINLAADMTDPDLPSNPRKAILYRPSATELVAVIATICEELPAESILLLYISASGKAGSKLTSRMETSGSLRNSSNLKVDSQSFRECDRSRPLAPIHDKGGSADSFADSLWLGPKGPKGRGSNDLYPGDIIPFTRRPLFLIVDSDNSCAFKVVHGAELGETAALLLSPRRPAFWSPSSTAERTKNGSQFTFFLTAPLQAFCQLVGLSVSDTDKDVYNKADMIISSTLSEWEVRLCTSNCLNLVWAQVLSDPFLRRLILRFIFCRAVLSLFCLPEDGDAYLPECLPELPEYVSPNSDAVQSNVFRLAESLGVVNRFHFDESL